MEKNGTDWHLAFWIVMAIACMYTGFAAYLLPFPFEFPILCLAAWGISMAGIETEDSTDKED